MNEVQKPAVVNLQVWGEGDHVRTLRVLAAMTMPIMMRPVGVPPSGGPVWMLMHGRPLVYRHNAFWRGRTVAQRAMRFDCVVVIPPTLDQDLSFA
jgi:hypothetical protein